VFPFLTPTRCSVKLYNQNQVCAAPTVHQQCQPPAAFLSPCHRSDDVLGAGTPRVSLNAATSRNPPSTPRVSRRHSIPSPWDSRDFKPNPADSRTVRTKTRGIPTVTTGFPPTPSPCKPLMQVSTGHQSLVFSLLLLVCVSFTIIGQPRNSVLIRRV